MFIENIFFQGRAVQHYEQAADYFKGEESTSSANKCMLKVAQYAAQLEDFEKAIQIYEQVISHTNYVFHTLICDILVLCLFDREELIITPFFYRRLPALVWRVHC